MNRTAIITWVLLLVFTIVSAVVSNIQESYIPFIVLFLAALKFLGVAFQFMELKKAHSFWKTLVFIYLIVVIVLIFIVK